MKRNRIFSILSISLLCFVLSCETGTDPQSGSGGGETLAPLISLPDGTYAGTQTVFMQAQEGAEIYYTLDGADPTEASAGYSDPLTIDSSLTLKAVAIKDGNSASAISIRQYTITSPANSVSAAPVINLESGTFTETQTVTISAAAGAAIYYTINGSKPTSESTLYNNEISISSSLTLRAIAIEPGRTASAEAVAVYTITGTLTPPTITPFEGTYTTSQTVALFSEQGAEIRYTTNGDTPTGSSPIYTGPFTVDSTTQIRAICLKSGWNPSLESAAQFTITGRLAAPTATPPAGTYADTQTVTLTAAAGAFIYFTIDGTAPTADSTLYTAPVTIDRSCILRAVAIQDGWDASETIYEPYQIQDQLYPPQISLAGGMFTGSEEITITAAAGADIYYTLDGSYPDRDSLHYSGPFMITETCAIQAIAVKSGLIDSETSKIEIFYAEANTDFETVSDGDGGLVIINYRGFKRFVIIPPQINGLSITKIGDNCFFGDSNIESVELPNTIREIGYRAFSNCYNLENINLPNSIILIDNEAFNNCINIETIVIPESVKTIGRMAFSSCYNLKEVTISDGVKTIGDEAFSSCAISNINIPGSITSFGTHVFFNCYYLSSVTIEEGITSIGEKAFMNCKNLTFIIIPDSVTSIGLGAFTNCESITSIIIPETISSIGIHAFFGCSALKDINIPDNITTIERSIFYGCSSLDRIILLEHITSIGDSSFFSCTSLTSIDIPEGVTSIGNNAFEGCRSLRSISIPTSTTSIGYEAFSSCTALNSIIIPENITILERNIFYSCSSLRQIVIPEGVTSINQSVFSNCVGLNSITFESTIAPILSNNPYPFSGITNCTLRYPSGATGYDVYPWTNTSIFSTVETF